MGSGKSTIGHLLSKNINFNFLDVDKFIEKEEGIKIYDIFQKEGESYFRNLEEKISLKLLKNNKNIISLGGGGFINKNIRKEIIKNHISFWLNWNAETLIYRIKNSSKRPLAFKASKNQLANLINKRSNIYSKALYKIDCESLTKKEVVKKILDIYDKH